MPPSTRRSEGYEIRYFDPVTMEPVTVDDMARSSSSSSSNDKNAFHANNITIAAIDNVHLKSAPSSNHRSQQNPIITTADEAVKKSNEPAVVTTAIHGNRGFIGGGGDDSNKIFMLNKALTRLRQMPTTKLESAEMQQPPETAAIRTEVEEEEEEASSSLPANGRLENGEGIVQQSISTTTTPQAMEVSERGGRTIFAPERRESVGNEVMMDEHSRQQQQRRQKLNDEELDRSIREINRIRQANAYDSIMTNYSPKSQTSVWNAISPIPGPRSIVRFVEESPSPPRSIPLIEDGTVPSSAVATTPSNAAAAAASPPSAGSAATPTSSPRSAAASSTNFEQFHNAVQQNMPEAVSSNPENPVLSLSPAAAAATGAVPKRKKKVYSPRPSPVKLRPRDELLQKAITNVQKAAKRKRPGPTENSPMTFAKRLKQGRPRTAFLHQQRAAAARSPPQPKNKSRLDSLVEELSLSPKALRRPAAPVVSPRLQPSDWGGINQQLLKEIARNNM